MGMLSPYSLFILYNRYTEAMCLVPKNIVKTGCVYIPDHLNFEEDCLNSYDYIAL